MEGTTSVTTKNLLCSEEVNLKTLYLSGYEVYLWIFN